jgi:hypothetical protein
MIFLSKTRKKSGRVCRLRNGLGLRIFSSVDSRGMSGGLALFWNESIYIDIKDATYRFIDAYVHLTPNEPFNHVTF